MKRDFLLYFGGLVTGSTFWLLRGNPNMPWYELISIRELLWIGMVVLVVVGLIVIYEQWVAPRLLMWRHRWIEDLSRDVQAREAAVKKSEAESEQLKEILDKAANAHEELQADLHTREVDFQVHIEAEWASIDKVKAAHQEAVSAADQSDRNLRVRQGELDARDRAVERKETELGRREQGIRATETQMAKEKQAIQAQMTEAKDTLVKARTQATLILDQAEQEAKRILTRANETKAEDAPERDCLLIIDFISRKGRQIRRQDLLASKLLSGGPAYDRVIDSLLRAGNLSCDDTPGKRNDWIYTLI
jgi:hypothetical protein